MNGMKYDMCLPDFHLDLESPIQFYLTWLMQSKFHHSVQFR